MGEMAVREEKEQDPRIPRIVSCIRVVPDFPKKGIMFQDITTLLLDPKAFKDTVDLFVERYTGRDICVVAGSSIHRKDNQRWKLEEENTRSHIFLDGNGSCDDSILGSTCRVEARGLIFGPPIALAIGAKFIPLRKPRKLPGEVISENYILEYGTDCLEMHVGAVQPGERALVVDDLIATGGTLCAAISLLERAGAEVVECACVIELPELKGREKLHGKPLYILMESR
ncbi:adenine phosphoribosyltransferase 4-like isoform X1 [Zingiber officinale]|uniref:adenine phosphoribosyltransferase 4-like isoform X1 n=1 Tax=Zingiber officinale TaxID=94328 RepID=UPI001C4B65CA|nr:adenine phosphoribosyltransferase 4-like isoform X1 [Zingiber officinale]